MKGLHKPAEDAETDYLEKRADPDTKKKFDRFFKWCDINGIEHPTELGIGVLRAKLFAQDPVRGVGLGDELTHEALGFLVGPSHGRAVGLNLEAGIRVGVRGDEYRAGDVRQGFGKLQQLGLARIGEHG